MHGKHSIKKKAFICYIYLASVIAELILSVEYQMREIFWVGENLLVSQEGLCFIELVSCGIVVEW
jgi:hypothetical protein